MALPMVLLLLSLRVSARASLLGALAAIAAVLCVASAAAMAPQWTRGLLGVMDPNSLDMVRERSQFVFLSSCGGWRIGSRTPPALRFLGARDARDPRWACSDALRGKVIVGAAGLAIAFVAGVVGPHLRGVGSGQAWRWTWVTGLASVLMLAPTVLQVWRSERCGPLCAALLLVGWLVSALGDGVYFHRGCSSVLLPQAHYGGRGARLGEQQLR